MAATAMAGSIAMTMRVVGKANGVSAVGKRLLERHSYYDLVSVSSA